MTLHIAKQCNCHYSSGLLLWIIKGPQRIELILLNDISSDVFCAIALFSLTLSPYPCQWLNDFQTKGGKKNEKGIVTLLLYIPTTNADLGFVLWMVFGF